MVRRSCPGRPWHRAATLLLTFAAGVALAAPPTAPVLLEPAASALLDNGRLDQDDDLEWRFRWTAVDGATGYQLRVLAPGDERAVVDVLTLLPEFLVLRPGAAVADDARTGWAWAVRARAGDEWGPWSPVAPFAVEPVDTDLPRSSAVPAACPRLRDPPPDAVLPDAAEGAVAAWRFEWTACAGADRYTIVVHCDGAVAPVVAEVAATAFTLLRCGPAGGDGACAWRVRARVDGDWGAWSEERAFQVPPAAPDRDPGAAADAPVCAGAPGDETGPAPPFGRP